MNGLIDFGIIKPELAGSLGAGFRASRDERSQREMSQLKLDQLKQDRAMLTDLQTKLQAAGKSTDPNDFFKALIQSGNPEYMAKGYEGVQRYQELQRADALLRKEAPELFSPAPNAAAPVNALASTAAPTAAPTNAFASTAAPTTAQPTSVNALANPDRVQELRNKVLTYSSSGDPRLKALADVYKSQLQELTKTNVVGGRLVSGAGNVMYEAPPETSDIKEYEYAKKNQGYKGSFTDFMQIKPTASAARNTVNVSTEKKYGERFGGLIADQDAAKLSAAENAPQAAATADRVMDLISTGKVITGTGANARLQIAKALNLAGGTDSEKIKNTEVLVSSLAETTLGAIKSSNLGAGQGFTNADRDFLEKAKAGQLSYDAKSLTELARLSRLAAEKSADSWNNRVKQIPATALEGTGISTNPIVVPKRGIMKNSGNQPAAAQQAPAGVDSTIWQFMTPEERKLWQK
jgi:hypothetical protein